jgi:hypothetical protein
MAMNRRLVHVIAEIGQRLPDGVTSGAHLLVRDGVSVGLRGRIIKGHAVKDVPLIRVSGDGYAAQKGGGDDELSHGVYLSFAHVRLSKGVGRSGSAFLLLSANVLLFAAFLLEVLDPLGQRLRTPAERRVHRRFVSAHCVVAGHDALGQEVPVEVGAQACHSVGEPARPCRRR